MLGCVDVDYRGNQGVAALVLFDQWTSAGKAASHVKVIQPVAAYEPGSFYKRELPCILEVLSILPQAPDIVVVDSYVWLDADKTRPGLGARLYDALGGATPVVGVAKTTFAGSAGVEVFRGASTRPLYVTAAGIDEGVAAQHVKSMYGDNRIPKMLKLVDTMCRRHRI